MKYRHKSHSVLYNDERGIHEGSSKKLLRKQIAVVSASSVDCNINEVI